MTSKVMLKSFLTNLLLGIIKVIGGFFTNSKTLISDGVHCLSDMLTDIVGIIGAKLSNKEPDETHPFGHGKIEYVTSILMSLLIISLGIKVLTSSFDGSTKITNVYAVLILAICIIIKITLSKYLLKKGKEYNSEILLTNGEESKYDSLSSIFGLLFIIISLFSSEVKIFKYADIIGSMIISIFTMKIGIKLFIKNIKSVIGEVDIDAGRKEEIIKIVLKNKKVKSIKRLNILKYGHYSSIIVEVRMDENITLKEFYKVETKIKKDIKNYDKRVKYVTVNIEPIKKETIH